MKKRTIVLLILIFMGHTIWVQEALRNVIVNGNLNVLTKIIQHNELWDLSQSELRILRNSIYAQYGYIFKSRDLQDHFKKFVWYHPLNENVDNNFTSIDKENITRIQNRENSLIGIITFQNTMLSWIQDKNIALSSDTIHFNTIFGAQKRRIAFTLGANRKRMF